MQSISDGMDLTFDAYLRIHIELKMWRSLWHNAMSISGLNKTL